MQVLNFLAAFVLFVQVAHVALDLFLSLTNTVLDLSLHLLCLLFLHRVDFLESLPMIDLVGIELLGPPHFGYVRASFIHFDRFLHVLKENVLLSLLLHLLLRVEYVRLVISVG